MDPGAVERKLAAIMFTDIVGYTALMGGSEESGHRVRERQGQVGSSWFRGRDFC